MARSPRRSKYYVRVARLRIETAVIEVDAANDDEAGQMALAEAMRLSPKAWTPEPFDDANYGPHVDTMVTGEDFDPPVELNLTDVATLFADTETRYLLLKASGDGYEGDVVLEPWFIVDHPDLLASDLTRDWIAALNRLGVTHLSERLDDLAAGEPAKPSDRILFSAPKPRKPDEPPF